MDLVYLAGGVAFFALAWLFCLFCERLMEDVR
jgi:hypothetical protein